MARSPLPTRQLPARPDLNQLKRQAKELLAAYRRGETAALAEVDDLYRDADAATFALHDAQLVLARAYGFKSWPRLKAWVDGATDQELVEATRRGDLAAVARMLETRPELASHPGALHAAVLTRAPGLVRVLMEHGARARSGVYPHEDATSPLTIARERDYDDLVAIIEEVEGRKAAVGARPSGGSERLLPALRSGDEATAIELMTSDADLIRERLPGTPYVPIQAAAWTNRPALLEWLLDQGASPTTGGDGMQPLDLAARRSRRQTDQPALGERFERIVELLSGRGAPMTACAAAALGDVAWLRAAHEAGTLANPIEDDGGLFSIAVRHEQPDVIRLLLDLGLDPDERVRVAEQDGDRIELSAGMPLVQCAFLHRPALAELLLDGGADPNAMVAATGSAVYIAWMGHDEPLIALLERYGGLPDLTVAAYSRRPDIVQRLLDDAEDQAAAGEELIRAAACGGDPDVLGLALERVEWGPNDERWFDILEQPLRVWNHGSDRARPEWDRQTYQVCFRMVLERCDPNLRGRMTNNRTPLGFTMLHHVAAARSRVRDEECVAFATMLLDAGARLDLRDLMLESTPLGWACRWGRAALVELFLERGADALELEAPAWARPQAWARRMGHDGIVARLSGEIP